MGVGDVDLRGHEPRNLAEPGVFPTFKGVAPRSSRVVRGIAEAEVTTALAHGGAHAAL